MKNDIDWSKSHCGVILCDYDRTLELMPEIGPILNELAPADRPLWDGEGYARWWDYHLIDVKVHMLMPGQFPCIPNWHCDFRPRDPDGKLIKGWTPDPRPMYMWLSGGPLTEYQSRDVRTGVPRTGDSTYQKPAQEWHSFTQADWHRGQAATEHTWRCFIRVIPSDFIDEHGASVVMNEPRRHTQVYLDSENFKW